MEPYCIVLLFSTQNTLPNALIKFNKLKLVTYNI